MSTSAVFSAEVEDLHQSIRKTGQLLRAVNAVRNLSNDLKDLAEKPTFGKLFWTIIQISRTYTALRRVMKATFSEAAVTWSIGGPPPPIPPIIPELTTLTMRVDAFRENLPMGLKGIDLSTLPEKTLAAIQRLLEEDAEETVADAKEILNSQIIAAPDEHTYDLENSIHWQPEVFATRIIAGMYYARWVEEGHDNFRGHWYLTGAVDLARQRLPDKIIQELNYLITKEN